MFTRKHFQQVADIFKANRPAIDTEEMWLWAQMREQFCYLFKESNPRFDEGKFLEAAGGELTETKAEGRE